ncbi:MAG: hypothetical protein IKE75_01250 [Bacilli bacterium]|nr:hypothetical protein [Bacilli bacterium]
MNKDFSICKNKILRMIKFIVEEYESIEKNYSNDSIMKKSIPIRLSKKVDKKDREQYDNIIELTFSPVLNKMSEMIDDNVIEWSQVSSQVELEEIKKENKKIVDLFYESTEKLYIYKKIRYNLFFDFLMQIYLFFERELSKYIIDNYNLNDNYINLFSGLNIIENKERVEINSSIKKELDLYRNIINIYKHGYGDSYKKVKETNPEILNHVDRDNDMYFVLNIKKINIDQLINCVDNLLCELEQKL